MNLDMYWSTLGVLTLRARESERLPGLIAMAVMLPRLGFWEPSKVSVDIDQTLERLIGEDYTFSRRRFKAYIHMTTASLEEPYL